MSNINTRNKTIAGRGIFKKRVAVPKEAPPSRKRRTISFKNKKIQIALGALCLLALVGTVSYYYYLHKNPLPQDPTIIYAKKVKAMTDQVSKYTALPTDEEPVIATISDKKVLPNEQFFKNAEDGDKILLYKKHKEAILFRPSTEKVITIAALDFRDVTPTPALSEPSVAGASTSADVVAGASGLTPPQGATETPYHPQGKILVAPQD